MRPAYALSIILAGVATLAAVPEPRSQGADRKAEPLVDQVRTAIDNGVRYLRRSQHGPHWENDSVSTLRPHGTTALAMLALLNCGVRPDDAAIQRGLEYLRDVEPKLTYVVGLQTMVFAEVGDPKDLPRIQRNVNWLIDARVFRDNKLHGWGYTNETQNTDYSNSQYALLGLHAGKQAGAKIDMSVWES